MRGKYFVYWKHWHKKAYFHLWGPQGVHTSAPWSSRTLTAFLWPCSAARASGVIPLRSRILASRNLENRTTKVSSWPFFDARWRHVVGDFVQSATDWKVSVPERVGFSSQRPNVAEPISHHFIAVCLTLTNLQWTSCSMHPDKNVLCVCNLCLIQRYFWFRSALPLTL